MDESLERWARHLEAVAALAVATIVLASALDRASSHTLAARIAASWRQTGKPRVSVRIPSPAEVSAVLSEAQRIIREAAPNG